MVSSDVIRSEESAPVVADVKGGNKKAIGRLIGQVKKANPNVNPAEVRDVLQRLIDELP